MIDEHHSDEQANGFGPRKLDGLRDQNLGRGCTRRYADVHDHATQGNRMSVVRSPRSPSVCILSAKTSHRPEIISKACTEVPMLFRKRFLRFASTWLRCRIGRELGAIADRLINGF